MVKEIVHYRASIAFYLHTSELVFKGYLGFVWIEEGICEEGREWICENWRGYVRLFGLRDDRVNL